MERGMPETDTRLTADDERRVFTRQALAAAEGITEEDGRDLLLSDLETIPGQSRLR
jgi:hypothetical protein